MEYVSQRSNNHKTSAIHMPMPRRPADTYEPSARVPMNFRVTRELRARLEQAADASGRSLMAEAEFRLSQSFAAEDQLGGPRAAPFFRSLSEEVTAYYGDDSWLRDPVKFEVVRSHIVNRLNATRIIPPAEGLGQMADMALNAFIDTRDPRCLDDARWYIAAPGFPAELREKALATIAEIESEPEAFRNRRITIQ